MDQQHQQQHQQREEQHQEQQLSQHKQEQQQKVTFRILALYKFVAPKFDPRQLTSLQEDIEKHCRENHARGCILLATEGINGTVCYPLEGNHDGLLFYFQQTFPNVKTRISSDCRNVFARLKVKIKPEIVTMSGRQVDPTQQVGEYVKPQDWNNVLTDPDCVIIDTRNDFEINVGTFVNAVNPQTTTFSDFPLWFEKNMTTPPKRIGMFCTGGIRCEKSTSLAKERFPNTPIYHLQGGILGYLEEIPEQESLFQGECYVFDQRVAVTHGLQPSVTYTLCHACRHPLSVVDRTHVDYREGLSCSYCVSTITDAQRQRFEERQRQLELAQENGTCHIYDPKE